MQLAGQFSQVIHDDTVIRSVLLITETLRFDFIVTKI